MANPNWKQLLPRALLIVAAGFWIFAPALTGDWLWDDSRLVVDNVNLRTISGLGHIWFAAPMTDYWPLSWSLLWLQWHLWGNLTFGYHLCSVALHLVSGFLIWHIFQRLGLRWAWFGGLLFVIHPLAVESVAWISEIKNMLSLPLFLLSLNAYMSCEEDAPPGPEVRWNAAYVSSFLFFLAAMLCKTSVVMLPAVLLLYAWWQHGQITKLDLQKTLPFFGLALLLGLVTLHAQSQSAATGAMGENGGLASRLIGAGTALFFYLGKFLDPLALLPVYPRWTLDPPSWLQLSTLPLLIILFLGFWHWCRSWGRHALLGSGFFVLTLLPVLGLLKMSYLRISPVADHLVYLPMIGLIGLAVASLEAIHQKLSPAYRPFLLVFISMGTALLAVKAHEYAGKFINGETLWTYTLTHNPGAVTARDNLGVVLLQSGRVAQAKEQFQIALQIDPLDATSHNNLAVALLQTHQLSEAIAECEIALRLNPLYAEAHDNLALALAQLGRLPEAIEHEQAALQIDPDAADMHRHLGDLLLQAQLKTQAHDPNAGALHLKMDR